MRWGSQETRDVLEPRRRVRMNQVRIRMRRATKVRGSGSLDFEVEVDIMAFVAEMDFGGEDKNI